MSAPHVAIFPDTSGKSASLYLLEETFNNSRVYRNSRCIADKVPIDDAETIADAIRNAFDKKASSHTVRPDRVDLFRMAVRTGETTVLNLQPHAAVTLADGGVVHDIRIKDDRIVRVVGMLHTEVVVRFGDDKMQLDFHPSLPHIKWAYRAWRGGKSEIFGSRELYQ